MTLCLDWRLVESCDVYLLTLFIFLKLLIDCINDIVAIVLSLTIIIVYICGSYYAARGPKMARGRVLSGPL